MVTRRVKVTVMNVTDANIDLLIPGGKNACIVHCVFVYQLPFLISSSTIA